MKKGVNINGVMNVTLLSHDFNTYNNVKMIYQVIYTVASRCFDMVKRCNFFH